MLDGKAIATNIQDILEKIRPTKSKLQCLIWAIPDFDLVINTCGS